jgi:transcriptional regulator with XRE-family HTH domain
MAPVVKDKKYAYIEPRNHRPGEMIVPSSLGRKLRERRKEKGSSKSYIWELEHKDTPRPSAEKLAKIAAVLDVTPEYLVNESSTAPDANEHDRAFFRKYQSADPDVKKKLKEILDLFDDT